MSSLYEELTNEMLAEFHYWISFNIKNGILTPAMNHELKLIEVVMVKRDLTLEELYGYRIMSI